MNEIRQIASNKVNPATLAPQTAPTYVVPPLGGFGEPAKAGTTYISPLANTAILLLTIAALASGCTYLAPKRARINQRLAEESRALTTAVVETLDAQPATNRDTYTQTALLFAKQNQRLEGLPEKPFDVASLLIGLSLSNSVPSAPLWLSSAQPDAARISEAREEVRERFAAQNALVATRAKLDQKLQDLGAQAEQTRNARITRWTKFSLWTTTLIGGLIALFVFCPVALPIVGRLLAWLVGKIPSLASALGVVSVKAYDAIIRGIEKAKDDRTAEAAELRRFPEPSPYVVPPLGGSPHARQPEPSRTVRDGTTHPETHPPTLPTAPTVPVANINTFGDSRRGQAPSFSDSANSARSAVPNSPAPAPTWIDRLHTTLSREMDAAHKALVRSRKTNLNQ